MINGTQLNFICMIFALFCFMFGILQISFLISNLGWLFVLIQIGTLFEKKAQQKGA